VIARHYTPSGFAFVMMDEIVLIYDLDHQEIEIPGEPEVMGRFLTSVAAETLHRAIRELDAGLSLHPGIGHLTVPSECVVGVKEFLDELLPAR